MFKLTDCLSSAWNDWVNSPLRVIFHFTWRNREHDSVGWLAVNQEQLMIEAGQNVDSQLFQSCGSSSLPIVIWLNGSNSYRETSNYFHCSTDASFTGSVAVFSSVVTSVSGWFVTWNMKLVMNNVMIHIKITNLLPFLQEVGLRSTGNF